MYHRILSVILFAFLTAVCSPDVIKGQAIDSLLYLIDNDPDINDTEKYDLLCQVIRDIDDTESKIRYCDQAIELAQKLDILPALPYFEKGEAYLDSGKLALALECYIQAVNYYEKNGDSAALGRTYVSMAETYNYTRVFPENEKLYLQKAIEIFEQEKDSIRLTYALHNLGYSNYSLGQYDTALVLYNETLDKFKKINKPYATPAIFVCLGNMGLVYSRLSDFDKAEEYLRTAIDTLPRLGVDNAVAEFMSGYANVLLQKGEIKQAITYASRALKQTDNPYFQREASLLLARHYKNTGRFDSAYYYQSIYIDANNRQINIENVVKMADLLNEYKVGKMRAEVVVLKRNRRLHNIIIIALVIILILAIGLVTLYYTNLKRLRQLTGALEERGILLEIQKEELKERNDEILSANEELKQLNEITSGQRDEIISSINYAQRIQSAMLPPETYITELLNENFILFKPKDIVSGDFYWIKQVKHFIILVAADCTGHGVPGAFMSMLGISHLNEIVQSREITQANEVLNELRKQVKQSLRQSGQRTESREGIDMALCVIDTKLNILQYSGANNPLYIISTIKGKPELKEIKADNMPVGVHLSRVKSFTNHEIKLDIGDTLYIFSDGYIDQSGGKDNKRFSSTRFKKMLLDIHDQAMYEQKEVLEKVLNEWMGDNPQRDDILVIGVRV